MAITETRQYREPFVEAAGVGVVDQALPLLKSPINTGSYTGSQFVQGQAGLETGAASAAAGLGSLLGPTGYQQFMSPYQQEVIDTTMSEFDRQASIQQQGLRDQSIRSGAYGGGREGVQQAEYQRGSDIARSGQLAGLLQQGYQNAQQTAGQQLAAQQGLGQYQSQLGGLQRQIGQAGLTAQQEGAREAAFEPFTRLGLVAPQLASVIGGFPAATQSQSTPPPSTSQQLLGLGIGGAGIAGALKGLF
jgi:hypothetical protein|tara:strand:+ start:99 stop:839 length:741 start_codon:yes stop_codon:yes gene_type:complete